ncbi:MAG TPA: hypothetical protein VKY27_10970 [Bacteriovoracaceae bacterium]|nr:hypothetical protein [Bacteriovoracaceae bacterium]
MEPKKKIDSKRTEIVSGDGSNYGDGTDIDFHHYLGNDENIPREDRKDREEEDIGKVAQGNVESFEQSASP